MKEKLEALISIVKNYIEETGCSSPDEFSMTKKLNDIILYQREIFYNDHYTKRVSIEQSYKLALSYLNSISTKYGKYLQLRRNDKTIFFDHHPNITANAFSEYNAFTDQRKMYIPVRETVEDSFRIVHEIFHDSNIDVNFRSIARILFTEGISFLNELLLEDNLIERKVPDAKIPNHFNFHSMKLRSIEVDLDLKLVTKYLENSYLKIQDLIDIVGTYPYYYTDYLKLTIDTIIKEGQLTLTNQETYIFGVLTGAYMYDRIKQDPNNIREMIELNEMLVLYSVENVFEYLNLDIKNGNLSEYSYQKLKNSYQNVLKRG